MIPFIAKAILSTPIALRNPIHLDGVLLAAREMREGPASRGKDLPLRRRDGIWQASAGVLQTIPGMGVRIEDVGRVKALRPQTLESADIWWDSSLGMDCRKLDNGGVHRMRNVITEYVTHQGIEAVLFQGVGDIDAIRNLLDDVTNLGTMYQTGYGAVTEWEVFPCGADPETAGHVGERNGTQVPLRALPVGTWAPGVAPSQVNLPNGAVIDNICVCPPYWDEKAREPAVTPTLRSLTMGQYEAEALLAA